MKFNMTKEEIYRNPFGAIKNYKEAMKCSLKEAKESIETLMGKTIKQWIDEIEPWGPEDER